MGTTVTFKKMCSDGNFGHESAEVMLEVATDDEADSEQIAVALAMCRRLVFDELRASPSPLVRRALEYPRQPVAVGVDEDPDPDDLPY